MKPHTSSSPAAEEQARRACRQLDQQPLPAHIRSGLEAARRQALAQTGTPDATRPGHVLVQQWHEHPWRWAAALALLAALIGNWQWQQQRNRIEQNIEIELLTSEAGPDLLLSDALEQRLRKTR
ncbi:DUF3619 family protein [Chitinilyticum aquatile]|uniref:DUF3619 family protein n=1 Tax=Chitinilyticum aquatile TaxID=362520 RepID=UPI0003F5D3D1|nr:DUF3619 family protein [Chitinilyticum aquatile]